MPAYSLHLTEVAPDTLEVAAKDKPSLAVIRDEVKLHGYEAGDINSTGDDFCFRVKSDEPGKVREFLMGLTDVEAGA